MMNHYNLCYHFPPVRPVPDPPKAPTGMHLDLYNVSDVLVEPPLVRAKVITADSQTKTECVKDSDPQLSSATEEMTLLSVQQGTVDLSPDNLVLYQGAEKFPVSIL